MIATSTPVGVQETRNTLSGVNVNTSKVFCGKSDHDEIIPDEYVDIVIGVFFDGTMNNRKNTQSRVAHEKKERGETLTPEEKDAEKNFISAEDKDTSYSYGVKHSNDTRDLHLNAVSKAHNTLKLAAADEHHVNFRLTNINSSGSRETEKFLPGWRSLIGTRTNISNKYSYIPLQIMSEFAEKKKVQFLVDDFKAKYTIEEESKSKNKELLSDIRDYLGIPKVKLTDVKVRIDAYIKGDKGRITFDNEEDKKMLRSLRNYYFHFSSHYKNTA